MRLLLDEHLSPVVARQLRARGHDVIAVVELSELRASDDAAILALGAREGRTLVTADVGFIRLANASAAGEGHAGLVLVPRGFPTARRSIGPLVSALDNLLRRWPSDAALADRVVWLDSPDGPAYSSR